MTCLGEGAVVTRDRNQIQAPIPDYTSLHPGHSQYEYSRSAPRPANYINPKAKGY